MNKEKAISQYSHVDFIREIWFFGIMDPTLVPIITIQNNIWLANVKFSLNAPEEDFIIKKSMRILGIFNCLHKILVNI